MKKISGRLIIEKYNQLPKQIKASFWFLACVILQKGITIITTPIFTRIMDPSVYGEFSVYSSWESVIGVFVTLRLTSGVYTQYLVKHEEKKEAISVAMQGLSTAVMAGFFIVYLIFHSFFNRLLGMNTAVMVSLFVILWSGEVFGFWACEQRIQYEYKKLVAISVLASLVIPIAGIIAVLTFKDQVTARIISLAIVGLIFYLPLFILKLRMRQPFFSGEVWKYALKFNLPLIPHYLSQTILSRADVIMIRTMVGPAQAGIYSLSYSLALLLLIVNSAIMQTLTPWMYSKMKQKQIEDMQGVSYMILIMVALLNLFLIGFAPEVIRFFAPAKFYEAIWTIPPIAMSSIFIFSYDLFSAFQFYHEKTFFVMLASVFGAGINIILNYIFIQQFGYIAAGYTTLACYMLYALGHFLFMKRVCKQYYPNKKPFDAKILLAIYATFMGMGFGIMLTYRHPVLRISVIAILLLVVMLNHKFIRKVMTQLIELRKK